MGGDPKIHSQTVSLTLGGIVKLSFDLKKKNGNARRGQLTFERGTALVRVYLNRRQQRRELALQTVKLRLIEIG